MDITKPGTKCDVCSRKHVKVYSYKFKRVDDRVLLCDQCADLGDKYSIPNWIPNNQIKKYYIERIKDGKEEINKHSKQKSKSQRIAEMGSTTNFRHHGH